MTTDTDLHVEWAKLEDEFLELNLLADRNLQQQLEAVRIAFDCQQALIVGKCRTVPAGVPDCRGSEST